jgi:hypothetical protein
VGRLLSANVRDSAELRDVIDEIRRRPPRREGDTIGLTLRLYQRKNWLPIAHKGMLHFVYSLEPLVVLRCEIPSGRLDFVDPRCAEYSRSSFTFLLCGSTSGICLDNRQLLIVHRRTVRLPRLRQIYVHRCATLNPSLTKLQFGRYFVIGGAEVQFVAGMDVDDDIVRLSYGRMDRSAHLAEFDRGTFVRTFVPGLSG